MLFFYLIFDFYTDFTFFETFQIKYSPSPGMENLFEKPINSGKTIRKTNLLLNEIKHWNVQLPPPVI